MAVPVLFWRLSEPSVCFLPFAGSRCQVIFGFCMVAMFLASGTVWECFACVREDDELTSCPDFSSIFAFLDCSGMVVV